MSGPLNFSLKLSDVKTAFPLIADAVMTEFRLVGIEAKTAPPKAELHPEAVVRGPDGNPVTLNLQFETINPVKGSEGQEILPGSPGSKIFDPIQLYSKPDAKDPAWFVKKLATRVDALLGTGDPGNTKGKPERPALDLASPTLAQELIELLVGKVMIAKVKLEKSAEYGDKNSFAALHFPGDLKA